MEQEGPVTVVVRHRVRSGREGDFEDWLRGICRAALPFLGHQGFQVVRPHDPLVPEYVVTFRFDTFANLERWENSDVRRGWIERLGPLTAAEAKRERHTGMEVWFAPPAGRSAPPRWKMALVTLLAIYPLMLAANVTVAPLLADWPFPMRSLAMAALLVCLMTYGAMPFMTRLFTRWLYGSAPT